MIYFVIIIIFYKVYSINYKILSATLYITEPNYKDNIPIINIEFKWMIITRIFDQFLIIIQ